MAWKTGQDILQSCLAVGTGGDDEPGREGGALG